MAEILTEQRRTDTTSVSTSNRTYSALQSLYGQSRPVLRPLVFTLSTSLPLSAMRSDIGCRLSDRSSPLLFFHAKGDAISPKEESTWMVWVRCLHRSQNEAGSVGRPAFPGISEEGERVGGRRGEGKNDGGEDGWVCPFPLALENIFPTKSPIKGTQCPVKD